MTFTHSLARNFYINVNFGTKRTKNYQMKLKYYKVEPLHKMLHDSAHPIYCKLHILKFNDMIYLTKYPFHDTDRTKPKISIIFPRT